MLLKSVSAWIGHQNDHCLSMVIKENTVCHNREECWIRTTVLWLRRKYLQCCSYFHCRSYLASQCPVFHSPDGCFIYTKSDLDLLFVVPQYKNDQGDTLCLSCHRTGKGTVQPPVITMIFVFRCHHQSAAVLQLYYTTQIIDLFCTISFILCQRECQSWNMLFTECMLVCVSFLLGTVH